MSEPATTQPPAQPRLSPKEQFLKLEDKANSWRSTSRSDLLLLTLTYSFSEFALSTPEPSAEQIKGVRNFIDIMLNLAEPKPTPRGPIPDKRLTMPPLNEQQPPTPPTPQKK